jgi:hypothetical protein
MKAIAPAIGAIASVVLITAPAAEAKSKWADIRIVTSSGDTLADHRQYTDDVKVKSSEDADCFGESNPSSDDRYALDDPTTLGTLIDATKADRELKPLLITDAFFAEFGSFGVCGIGEFVGSPVFGEEYWYSAVNGTGATAGPNQIPVHNRDSHLWYFATGAEEAISELEIATPYEVQANDPFEVEVIRKLPDGTTEPAAGVDVTQASEPTDTEGKTTVEVGPGTSFLVATGTSDDVPSRATEVCADARFDCPNGPFQTIFGSPVRDKIKATRGPDAIDCGRGKDVVKKAESGLDEIAGNCEKVKR